MNFSITTDINNHPRTPCNREVFDIFLKSGGKMQDFHHSVFQNTSSIVYVFAQEIGDRITFLSTVARIPKDTTSEEYSQELQDLFARIQKTALLTNSK